MTPIELPASFDRSDLEAVGFVGWASWLDLRTTGLEDVPNQAGTYVVVRSSRDQPAWLTASPAGHFKQRDPTVSKQDLTDAWIDEAFVLYIGKASLRKRTGAKNGLRQRLDEYQRFGGGAPVAHWGGRCIWQLEDADSLLVAWRPSPDGEDPREHEKQLLTHFSRLHHGRRPFANRTG